MGVAGPDEGAESRVPEAVLRQWSERLSDRIRSALDAGDLGLARRLGLEGDGEARSLAKEYTLMYKGLGITVRVLLGILGDLFGRGGASPEAERALTDILARFRTDMIAALRRACPDDAEAAALGEVAVADGASRLRMELDVTTAQLGEIERLFIREQARIADETVRALEAGDAGRARALVDRKEREQYLPLHDRLVRLMAEVFGFVLARFGPAELQRFHRATAEGQRAGFEQWERLTPAEFTRATAFLLKQHMGRFEIHEDGEKFTIEQSLCGSGGRLRLAGAYAGPGALPFVEGPGALTLGQPRLPVYCSHCPIWNGVAAVEWFGHPQWVFEGAARQDGSCTVHIYKRPDRIPARRYRELGFEGGHS
jgi:hypothetical protein